MKRTFTLLFAVLLTAGLWAQIPQKMNYQVIVRDTDNNLIRNQSVGIQISILQGSENGDVVYTESMTTTTGTNGLVTVEFGGEAGFDAIEWGDGPYFIKSDIDPAGNTNYSLTGTSQLLSVPYAFFAGTAETILETDPVFSETFDLQGAQTGDVLQFDGEKWIVLEGGFAEADHVHSLATENEAGFMSAEDKIKLDGLTDPEVFHTSIISSSEITVTGEGTEDDPYIISLAEGSENGEMLYWDGDEWIPLPPGQSGLMLTLCNGVPVWGPCPGLAVVTIAEISDINLFSAIAKVNVISEGDEISERGVVYSREPEPTEDDSKIVTGTGAGFFDIQITRLRPQQIYYVRGYAINNSGTAYSAQMVFSTLEVDYSGTVTDADNNTYNTIMIGSQEWIAENLRTTKFHDGENTAIPNLTSNTAWAETTSGAYATHGNNSDRKEQYGLLYNWYAVADSRNLCPSGWRVATDTDWTTLSNFIADNTDFGGSTVGMALKSCRQVNSPLGGDCATTIHPRWEASEVYGTDNFKFAAPGGGNRSSDGSFHGLGSYSNWWTLTQVDENQGYARGLFGSTSHLSRSTSNKKNGFYVRCMRE